MTISTIVANPFSFTFILCNYITFCVFKSMVIGNAGEFSLSNFVLTLLMSLIAITVYSLIDMMFLKISEKSNIANSEYNGKIKCNVFKYYNAKYIFKIENNTCNIYVHSRLTKYLIYKDNKEEYLSKMKARILDLNKLDRLYIYLFKYICGILLSITFMFLLQIARCMSWSTILELVLKMGLLDVIGSFLIILYFIINGIFIDIITKIMEKRGLEFFLMR